MYDPFDVPPMEFPTFNYRTNKIRSVECNPGKYRDTTITSCDACPENWITDDYGASLCTYCTDGHVSNTERTMCSMYLNL